MISTSTFEIFQTRDSIIHHLDPRVKLISTLLLVVSNVLLPDGSWFLFAVTMGILFFLSVLSRVNLGFIFKVLFILLNLNQDRIKRIRSQKLTSPLKERNAIRKGDGFSITQRIGGG